MSKTKKSATQERLTKESAERAAKMGKQKEARLAALESSKFESSPVRLISIADIHVGERLRALNADEVDKLATSMQAAGQLAPIVVRKTPRSDTAYALVAGLHRLQAAQKLGQDLIQAAIHEAMEPAAAEMAEITENLMRFDLSPAERIAHTDRWKALYEAEHPEVKHGSTGRGRGKSSQNEQSNSSAAEHIAENTERGASSVRRDMTIAKKLGKKLLAEITGTSLDKDAEMLALCELPPLLVKAIVAKAQAGEEVSAKKRLAEWEKSTGESQTALRARAESLGYWLTVRGKKLRLINKDIGADNTICDGLDAVAQQLDKISARVKPTPVLTASAERPALADGAPPTEPTERPQQAEPELDAGHTANEPPSNGHAVNGRPDDDRPLAEKLHYALNDVWSLCEDQNNWPHLSADQKVELRGAMTKLGYLRELLPRLATPSKSKLH
jgi:ParB family transcriptional regulator, chromosome partitioning protein